MNLTRTPRSLLSHDGLKIWTNPSGSPNIVVYCRGTLYISAIAPHDLNLAAQRLMGGAAPGQVFGSYHQEIPLGGVSQAEVDLKHRRFRFSYTGGVGTLRTEFELASDIEVHELATVLRQQFGDCYEAKTLGFDLIRTWGVPLIAGFVHGLVWFTARQIMATSNGVVTRTSLIERFLRDRVGEQGLLTFGVAISALILTWLAVRFIQRPSGVQYCRRI